MSKQFESRLYNAWVEGRYARRSHESRSANPYPRTALNLDTLFAHWERGWVDEDRAIEGKRR